MTFTRFSLGLAMIAAIGTTFMEAAAQEKREPVYVIRDCVTFLKLSEMQRRVIARETLEMDILKDRTKQSGQKQSPAATSDLKLPDQSQQSPSATATVDHAVAIGKLSYTIEKDRAVLAAIEHQYDECLKAPPWQEAKAVPKSEPAEKKSPAKRTTARSQRAPRPESEGRGPPPQGGHSPGASGLMGVIGGGGVGIGF